MIKTNIKMRVTPEQSRRVQEICFENGIIWTHKISKPTNLHLPYLFICSKDGIYGTSDVECYDEHKEYQEVNADLFIKTNGACELTDLVDIFEDICNQISKEIYIEKHTSQPKDLASALKKIENLHIALKKKVERNKNQALEITKLLEEKKAMKYDINIAINHLLEMKELKAKLKEKDTIISYLESKLK